MIKFIVIGLLAFLVVGILGQNNAKGYEALISVLLIGLVHEYTDFF